MDIENETIKPLMLNVKNKAVGNWYAIMASMAQTVTGITLNTAGAGEALILNSATYNMPEITQGSNPQTPPFIFRAGTDTTTATTASMADIAAPTSSGSTAGTVQYPTPNTAVSSVQWSGVWAANTFGSGPTIQLGEFGLCICSTGITAWSLIRRVCVADGNFSPLTITTSLPLTISVLVANQ